MQPSDPPKSAEATGCDAQIRILLVAVICGWLAAVAAAASAIRWRRAYQRSRVFAARQNIELRAIEF